MTDKHHDPKGVHLALLSPDDLAARWQCSKGWLANQRCAGTGPSYVKLGTRIAYRLSDVLAYEDAATVQTVPA